MELYVKKFIFTYLVIMMMSCSDRKVDLTPIVNIEKFEQKNIKADKTLFSYHNSQLEMPHEFTKIETSMYDEKVKLMSKIVKNFELNIDKFPFSMPSGEYFIAEIEINNDVFKKYLIEDFLNITFQINPNKIVACIVNSEINSFFPFDNIYMKDDSLNSSWFHDGSNQSGNTSLKFYHEEIIFNHEYSEGGAVQKIKITYKLNAHKIILIDNRITPSFTFTWSEINLYKERNTDSDLILKIEPVIIKGDLLYDTSVGVFKIIKNDELTFENILKPSWYYIEYHGKNGWVQIEKPVIFKNIQGVKNYISSSFNL